MEGWRWYGKPIETMSREELIAALSTVLQSNRDAEIELARRAAVRKSLRSKP